MRIFGLIVKSVATLLLVSALVMLSLLMLALLPIYLALIVKGKAKAATILQVIPLGIIAGFLWKLWKPEGISATERAYREGIDKGQLKAARAAGMIEGMQMIAQPEDLSLKPVYSLRDFKTRAQDSEVIPY